MYIQVLGAGGAFSPELGNSSIIIWSNYRGFLIDCGYTVYPVLKQQNLVDKIDKVFITHRHGDHIGSLDTFLFHKRYICQQKTQLFGVTDCLPYLKEVDPSFGKEFDEFFTNALENDGTPEGIEIIPTKHTNDITSYAFNNYGILYSGDTNESLLETTPAKNAKVILHEVTFNKSVDVHAQFDELVKASDEIKNKTWLYHYSVNDVAHEQEVIKAGFKGFLKKDQIIEVG